MTPPTDPETTEPVPTTLRPPDVSAADVSRVLADGAVFVALDDDPTGTQTVRDVPVLTRWSADDVRWALEQGTPGFFVLTNTRSLPPRAAAARITEIVEACLDAAEETGRDVVFANRGDSTLRGHFPVEVDAVRAAVVRRGGRTDGIVLAPAYLDAGRVTVHGVQMLRAGGDGASLTPVASSEFARDATFGYRSSLLADWVEEKSGSAIPASSVTSLDVDELRAEERGGNADRVTETLAALADGGVVALDALDDADLRRAVVAIVAEERAGRRFVFQVGPSFVRARLGQDAQAPIPDDELATVIGATDAHGLVVVGSHVALTTRQLDALRASTPVDDVVLDVSALVDGSADATVIEDLADRVARGLGESLVVLSTSRLLVRGTDPGTSLDIARRVSDVLTAVVRAAVERTRPAYVVAKGGITSSDIATGALGVERAWVRGSLLPGIVSLWQTEGGPSAGLPYMVFAGNVGDDTALASVVARLERGRRRP